MGERSFGSVWYFPDQRTYLDRLARKRVMKTNWDLTVEGAAVLLKNKFGDQEVRISDIRAVSTVTAPGARIDMASPAVELTYGPESTAAYVTPWNKFRDRARRKMVDEIVAFLASHPDTELREERELDHDVASEATLGSVGRGRIRLSYSPSYEFPPQCLVCLAPTETRRSWHYSARVGVSTTLENPILGPSVYGASWPVGMRLSLPYCVEHADRYDLAAPYDDPKLPPGISRLQVHVRASEAHQVGGEVKAHVREEGVTFRFQQPEYARAFAEANKRHRP
jgi:hypothetical protein